MEPHLRITETKQGEEAYCCPSKSFQNFSTRSIGCNGDCGSNISRLINICANKTVMYHFNSA